MKKTLLPSLLLTGISLTGLYAQVPQKVVIEEFTGAWCGYCPEGAMIVEDIITANPDVYAVAVHNGDAMVTSAGNSIDNFFNSLGFPSAVLNRSGASIGRSSWSSQASSMTGGTCNLSVSFDSWTYDGAAGSAGTIDVTVRIQSFGTYSGNKRVGLILTEDDVTGTGSGYNQVNYFNTTAGHPYYGAGNPILGFPHNHVARAYLGGAWGQFGVLPYTINAGYDTTYTFSTALNSAWDLSQMHVIAYVSYYTGTGTTQRAMINSESIPMSVITASQQPSVEGVETMVASPNPFQDRTTATFSLKETAQGKVEVLNTLGQQVAILAEGLLSAGTHTETWLPGDAPNGIYFIRVSTLKGEVQTAKVMLSR